MVATVVTSHNSSLSSINIPRSLTDVAVAKFDVLTGYGQIDEVNQFPSKRNCSAFLLAERIRGGIMKPDGKEVRCCLKAFSGGRKYVMDTNFSGASFDYSANGAVIWRCQGISREIPGGGGILVRVGETKHGDKTSISYEALVFQNHELASEYISPNRVLESRP